MRVWTSSLNTCFPRSPISSWLSLRRGNLLPLWHCQWTERVWQTREQLLLRLILTNISASTTVACPLSKSFYLVFTMTPSGEHSTDEAEARGGQVTQPRSYRCSMAVPELEVGLDLIARSFVFSRSPSYVRSKSLRGKEGSRDLPRSLTWQGWPIQMAGRVERVS